MAIWTSPLLMNYHLEENIKTIWKSESGRLNMLGFVRKEIEKGRQAYIVYPLINESESMDYKDLMDGYESICRAFKEYNIPLFMVK